MEIINILDILKKLINVLGFMLVAQKIINVKNKFPPD